jgi:hypothetical protein
MLKEAVGWPPIPRKSTVNIQVIGKEEHQGIGVVGLEATENVAR